MALHEQFAKGGLTLIPRHGIDSAKEAHMPFVLQFPDIDPEIFAFDLFGLHLALRWYALAYIAGLVIG